MTIPAGAQVIISLAAANHDERTYDHPEVLDIDRTVARHLAFGHGIHHCLGAPLARLEGHLALGTLLRRFPQLRLAVADDELRWAHGDGLVLRGLSELPVIPGPALPRDSPRPNTADRRRDVVLALGGPGADGGRGSLVRAAGEREARAMSITGTPVDNGVNVAALLEAREALTAAPEAAQFQWRASCTWKNGTHSKSTVEGFFGLGEEQHHKREFSFDADHPEIFASEDNGATPVEYVLVGLASCLTAGVAAVAQNREIQLRSVSATLEGEMDVSGILGIDSDVRNGFSGIKVTYDIDADATPDEIKAIVAQSQKRSAVYDIITNPTNVTVEVR